MKAFIEFVFAATLSVAFGIFMAIAVLEWMVGCGETYTDSKGVVHVGQCIFIPHQTKGN
jgi:hypothetical protein